MKKLIIVLLVSLSVNVFAQKEIKEGVIKTKMTMSSEDSQLNSQLAMMGDMTMSTEFKGKNSRTEMNNPMAGKNVTIVNSDEKKMMMLLDNPMMGKKYRTNDIKDISEEDLKNISVKEKGDTKTILGYVCKGYDIVVKTDGVENKMTMYTTEKIKAVNQNTTVLGSKAVGFPMYMTMDINQAGMTMTMTMEVTEINSQKIDDAKFKLTVPEGYTKMEAPKPATID
ncbi:hypothetical protein AAON49_14145 [Pseudotenacibaculum sp. MALMAid0570]|uniref:hypothetical protein n=1 Tax=Pseudotenacibaculum sp. MALMAid0570 TaxID=3143938 RepID=UPI0032E03A11